MEYVLELPNGHNDHFGLVQVEGRHRPKMASQMFRHGLGGRKCLPVTYGEKTLFRSKIGFCDKK